MGTGWWKAPLSVSLLLLLSYAGRWVEAAGGGPGVFGRDLKQLVKERLSDAKGEAEIGGELDLALAVGPDVEVPGPVEEFVEKDCAGQVVFFLEAKFNWTKTRHPRDYPAGAQWSPMYGAVHNELFSIFSVGGNASLALEEIAEQGTGKLFKKQVEECIEEGNCRDFLKFECDEEAGDCRMDGNFTVNTTYSYVSLVSMLQPSPDWFTGVSGLDLCNDGGWLQGLDLRLNASDAGTDAGKKYTSKDDDIPIPLRKGVSEYDKLSPSNPFYDPDFIPEVAENGEEDEEAEIPTELGGLADVLNLVLIQDRETAETEVTGTGEAVATDEVDTEDLTKKEINALEAEAAKIRTIGPENMGSLMACTPWILFASPLIALMVTLMA